MAAAKFLGPAAGVLAPLVYGATVFFGATLIRGYSHLRDPISALTQSGRTDVAGVDIAFLIYNGLVAGFAISLLHRSWNDGVWRAAYGLLLLTAVCGLLMWPFRQDPVGAAATTAGIVHLVLAGLESLSTVAILAIATARYWSSGRPRMAAFTVSLLVLTLTFGAVAALATALAWPLMGLYERLTIGAFELWMLAAAIDCWPRPPSLADRGRHTYNPVH